MTWLIVARALQGIGGGGTSARTLTYALKLRSRVCAGIFQMVNIVIGDIVPLEK